MSEPPHTWPRRLGLVCVLAFFCAPLFIGLRAWDLRSDEAIYSYEVDRIIETGEWLTPRSIPTDGPFLEKPPLKPWLVAGAIRLGILPFDERGMRAIDVLFACVAFVYVYLFGCRLAGTLAGVVSVFLLFSFDPLILEHGVRGNQMEAALLLAYCGGIYHFVRWIDGGRASVRRGHALAVGVYFTLGFMTKFVGMALLPIVCAAAFALAPTPWRRARDTWRDWTAPLALAVLACAPWFLYQTVVRGGAFWEEIFGSNVYTRFVGTLVASHRHPWHYYISQTWRELGFAGMRVAVAAGLVMLAVRAARGRDWTAQVILLWLGIPLAVISAGTSKLFYYVYPFFPPLALGGGLAAAMVFQYIEGPAGQALARRLAALAGVRGDAPPGKARRALAVIGAAALILAACNAVFGSLTLEAGGVRWFRSSSPARAAVIGIVLSAMSGYARWMLALIAVVVLTLVLPVSAYVPRVERFGSIDHPIQSVRDCALAVQAAGGSPATGVFLADAEIHHSYYYYLRRLGPWLEAAGARPDELLRRLDVAGEQSPVLMSKDGYIALGGQPAFTPGTKRQMTGLVHRDHGVPAGISIGDTVFILLPGPYRECVGPAVAGGGQELRARN